MKLKKCQKCMTYTLKEACKCGNKTKDSNYKYKEIKIISPVFP